MSPGPQTYGSDGAGPQQREEMLRLNGPRLRVIVRSLGPSGVQPGSDFAEQDALIDTGASDICIDARVARQLGLQAVDIVRIGVVGGFAEAVVYAGILEVPELHFSRIMRFYAPRGAAPSSQLLLGRSFLAHFIMTYDGPNGIFHFYNPSVGLSGPVDDE